MQAFQPPPVIQDSVSLNFRGNRVSSLEVSGFGWIEETSLPSPSGPRQEIPPPSGVDLPACFRHFEKAIYV